MPRKIQFELEPIFQAIVNKKPIDWFNLIRVTEIFIVLPYLKLVGENIETITLKQNAQEFLDILDIDEYKYLDENFEFSSILNETQTFGERALDAMVTLSFIGKVPFSTFKNTTSKEYKELRENIEQAKQKITLPLVIYFVKFIETVITQFNIQNEIQSGILLFKAKMLTFGADVITLPSKEEGWRDMYMVLLPTYLYAYYDDYVRPEIIGEVFNEIGIFDARTSLKSKLDKLPPAPFVPEGNMTYSFALKQIEDMEKFKRSRESYEMISKLYTVPYLQIPKILNKNGAPVEEFIQVLKSLNFKIEGLGDYQINDEEDYSPFPFYYFSPGPTGGFVAVSKTYRVKSANLENVLFNICEQITYAMGQPGMANLPQYNNPKIIEENRKKFNNASDDNGLTITSRDEDDEFTGIYQIEMLYFEPLLVSEDYVFYDLEKNKRELAVKPIKTSKDYTTAKVRKAQECWTRDCSGDENVPAYGPIIKKTESKSKIKMTNKEINSLCTKIDENKLKKIMNELKKADIEIPENKLTKDIKKNCEIVKETIKQNIDPPIKSKPKVQFKK